MSTGESPVAVDSLDEGQVWSVVLDRPKANVLDSEMIEALTATFRRAAREPNLKAIVLEGRGDHFSFGASVPEHRAEQVGEMLHTFRGLFEAMLEAAVFTVAAVRGRCLGGGLELAMFCNRMVAAPTAAFAQPEIVLGVAAPVASIYLPERVGRGAAEDLCLSGRTWSAAEAERRGLVEEVAEDPSQAALGYLREHVVPRSAVSLRAAHRMIRAPLWSRVIAELVRAEHAYVHELMRTRDANEGIAAFLDKRHPTWSNA